MGMSGLGAGLGADELQTVLQNLAERAFKQQALQDAAKRTEIEGQRVANENSYRTLAAQSAADARAQAAQAQDAQKAVRIASMLKPGQRVGAEAVGALDAGDAGDLVTDRGQTLGSRNLSGAAATTGAAPRILGLASTANPGMAGTYTGTASQLQGEQDRKDKAALAEQARLDRIAAQKDAQQGREELARVTAGLRPPPQDHFDTKDIADPENPGKTISVRINRQTGEISPLQFNGKNVAGNGPKLDATTANRLQSAKAVTQTGDDIIKQLSDPATAKALGAAMSRFNSVADFIGNAPPEWSKLAGLIESYSLANMGVHGMRSNTGAEAIKQTLGQGRHSPESMAAAIQGINGFAHHLMENNGQSATGPATNGGAVSATGGGGAKRQWYDMNGDLIKD